MLPLTRDVVSSRSRVDSDHLFNRGGPHGHARQAFVEASFPPGGPWRRDTVLLGLVLCFQDVPSAWVSTSRLPEPFLWPMLRSGARQDLGVTWLTWGTTYAHNKVSQPRHCPKPLFAPQLYEQIKLGSEYKVARVPLMAANCFLRTPLPSSPSPLPFHQLQGAFLLSPASRSLLSRMSHQQQVQQLFFRSFAQSPVVPPSMAKEVQDGTTKQAQKTTPGYTPQDALEGQVPEQWRSSQHPRPECRPGRKPGPAAVPPRSPESPPTTTHGPGPRVPPEAGAQQEEAANTLTTTCEDNVNSGWKGPRSASGKNHALLPNMNENPTTHHHPGSPTSRAQVQRPVPFARHSRHVRASEKSEASTGSSRPRPAAAWSTWRHPTSTTGPSAVPTKPRTLPRRRPERQGPPTEPFQVRVYRGQAFATLRSSHGGLRGVDSSQRHVLRAAGSRLRSHSGETDGPTPPVLGSLSNLLWTVSDQPPRAHDGFRQFFPCEQVAARVQFQRTIHDDAAWQAARLTAKGFLSNSHTGHPHGTGHTRALDLPSTTGAPANGRTQLLPL